MCVLWVAEIKYVCMYVYYATNVEYWLSVRHKEITDRQADRMIKPHRLTSTESSASRQLLTTALSWLMLFYARPAVPRVVVAQCVDTSARVGTVRSAHTRYTAWVTRSPATGNWARARVLFSHQGWSIFLTQKFQAASHALRRCGLLLPTCVM